MAVQRGRVADDLEALVQTAIMLAVHARLAVIADGKNFVRVAVVFPGSVDFQLHAEIARPHAVENRQRLVIIAVDTTPAEAAGSSSHNTDIHMLVSIPPKYSVSQIMGYLKGKSSLMIYEKYANLKYKYGNRHFWCRGYYVSTVGRNRRAIEEYIRNQLQEDYTDDQLSIKEFVDPFTGEPVRGGK